MNALCRLEYAHDFISWNPEPHSHGRSVDLGWDSPFAAKLSKPSRAYSKRSTKLANLRSQRDVFASRLQDAGFAAIKPAFDLAARFINEAPERALEFDLAFSDDGEINAFYGSADNLFHIFFDSTEGISYYAKFHGLELFGDELLANAFDWSAFDQYLQAK